MAMIATFGLLEPPAHGHVAPAKDRNNQYIKVTPMGDRVRLAYTIYIGDTPGRAARRRMDRNRDGLLDDDEKGRYGDATATAVRAGLSVRIDGVTVAVTWSLVDVGLGVAQTDARWFAVDMVTWLCIPEPTHLSHTLLLSNRFNLPRPGETELRVEESPGVTIERSTIAGGAANQLDFRWRGGMAPLAREPYRLLFKVDPAVASITRDGTCGGGVPGKTNSPARPPRRTSRLIAIAILGAGLLVAGMLWLTLRKRQRRAP